MKKLNKKAQISLEMLIILGIVIIVVVIASVLYISLTTKDVQDTSELIDESGQIVTKPLEEDSIDYNVITQLPTGLVKISFCEKI